MEGEAIVGLVAVIGLILVPSLAIAVRLSLKPMVEAVVRLHEALGKTTASASVVESGDEVRVRLSQLEAVVHELRESSAFYRELERREESRAGALLEQVNLADSAAQGQGAAVERVLTR